MELFDRNKYIFSEITAMVDVSERAIKVREKQISLLLKELFLYKVLIKDLITHKPNIMEKNLILNISYYLLRNVELIDKFQKKRELPFNKIASETQVSKGYLEKWQDYIVAYTIILSNPNYKSIQDYLRIEYKNDNTQIAINGKQKSNIYKGIIVKDNKRSSVILSSKGEFIKIKKTDDTRIGKEVEGTQKVGVKHIKLKLSIVAVLLLLIAFAGYRQYTKVVRTIIIEASSTIKIQTNRFDNVVYAYSDTEKGRELINIVDPSDKDIDEVMQKTIEYALDNKMIDSTMIFDKTNNASGRLLVTVTDEPIKFGKLKLTGEYIVDKKINLVINNAGYQQKLYESTVKQEEEENGKK